MSALRQLRESLLRIPFAVVVAAGFAVCALFPICAQPLGEAGVLLELPFAALWLITCALVLAHIHRGVAQSPNTLLQFGAPVAIALAYAAFTIYAGGAIGFWLVAHAFPHTASWYMSTNRSNQALQPTTTRCAFTFFMTTKVLEIFSLAPGSRG